MRVLEVVHALPPATYGGTELYARDLAAALADRGHEVAVAAPRGVEAAESAEDDELPGVETVALSDPGGETAPAVGGRPLAAVDRPATEDRIAGLLDEFDPDVVHCQHLKHLSAGIPGLCDERGVPCVLTLHDFWTVCHREQLHRPEGRPCAGPESVDKCATCYRRARREASGEAATDEGEPASDGDITASDADARTAVARRERRLRSALASFDLLVAPSRFLAERMAAFGVPAETLVQCRNGVRVGRFEDAGFDPARPLRVGYAGRITANKGVHLLVAAVQQVARTGEDDPQHGRGADDADLECHVYGRFDPESDDYHARLAGTAGDRTTFHGRYADRPEPYREMDVLVLPSVWYENSPLVIQEANAASVPVVTADVGGMAELVTDGEDGLTFPRGDAAALADRLRDLAGDPSLVADLREGVTDPKRLADHAAEVESLYHDVRGGRRPDQREGA